MNEMALIVPSRGRPENIDRLALALKNTNSEIDLHVGIDSDDPKKHDYIEVSKKHNIFLDVANGRERFGPTLNRISNKIWKDYEYLAWCGDDHLPRTDKWDKRYRDVLKKFHLAMVYGNDLVQGERIATQLAFTAKAVGALGYAVPPGFIHLYIDNYFMELFNSFNAMVYLPDVIVEHLHPSAGTSESDLTYQEANSPENWTNDKKRFEEYLKTELKIDKEKLIAII